MNSLSYKHKSWVLYLLLVLLAYLLYSKLFTGTIQLIQSNGELAARLESDEKNLVRSGDLKLEIERYNKLKLHNDSTSDPANEVLDFISDASSTIDVRVDSFDPEVIEELQGYLVHTFRIRITGNYISMLKMIDLMERRVADARLASTRFYSDKKNTNSDIKVYAELTMRYISKK